LLLLLLLLLPTPQVTARHVSRALLRVVLLNASACAIFQEQGPNSTLCDAQRIPALLGAALEVKTAKCGCS
jgi:hypothetical protein